jgi:hypothetical protein
MLAHEISGSRLKASRATTSAIPYSPTADHQNTGVTMSAESQAFSYDPAPAAGQRKGTSLL